MKISCLSTGGACRCKKYYDGLDDALLNVDNHFLVSHTTLLDFFSQFTEGNEINMFFNLLCSKTFFEKKKKSNILLFIICFSAYHNVELL